MAKAKGDKVNHSGLADVKTVSVKMSPAFHDWLSKWSDDERISAPVIIEHALLEFALKKGREFPPKRLSR